MEDDLRGSSSTPFDEEGLHLWCFTDAMVGGVRVSKNLREQFKSMHRHQFANTREHVLDCKWFGEETVGARVDAGLLYFGGGRFELIISTLECDRWSLRNSSRRMPAEMSFSGGICRSSMEMSGFVKKSPRRMAVGKSLAVTTSYCSHNVQ